MSCVCVPVNQPLDALVSRFDEEVGGEAGEEERDASVQLLVDLSGLDAPLQRQRGPTEQCVLELLEGWLDSQQLLQPCAAWRGGERGRWGVSGPWRERVSEPVGGLTEGVEGAPVHGRSIFGVEEQRGDLSAGQQVGVALRQRELLQLVGQRRHDGSLF